MLPDTITLNTGSPAADRIFSIASRQNGITTYYAPSPTDDLAGRPSLVVKQTESGGLMRSLVQFKFPYADAAGDYSDHIQKNMTLIRPKAATLTLVDEVLESAQEIWAITDFREDIGAAEL
jgi:hypothetical protein